MPVANRRWMTPVVQITAMRLAILEDDEFLQTRVVCALSIATPAAAAIAIARPSSSSVNAGAERFSQR
jgi:hypothetical protein